MTSCKRVVAWIFGLAGCASMAAILAVYFGWYDISATRPHTALVHRLLDIALARSVAVRADGIQVPDLNQPEAIQNGFGRFRAHCVQCHGAPGQAPEPYALGLNPAPAALVTSVRERTAAELFWIIREGIKMTGMPAWRYRLTDAQMWEVVAFMKVLPTLSPPAYQQWDEAPPGQLPQHARPYLPETHARSQPAPESNRERQHPSKQDSLNAPRTGDATAGRQALQQFLCTTCHAIPGVPGAYHHVGPSLAGIAARPFIAGVLPNTHENMRRWLMSPTTIKPGTAMPDLGIGEQDARDITAFLQTLSKPE